MPTVRTFTKGGASATATSQATADYLLANGWTEGASTPYDTTTPTADLQAQLDNETAWRTLIDSDLQRQHDLNRGQRSITGGLVKRAWPGATPTSPFGLEWSAMSFVGVQRSQWAAGFIDVYQPPAGTVVHGHGGAPDRTCGGANSGVPIGEWEALYYDVPAGGGSTAFGNYHLLNYTSDFAIPQSWVMIARRDGFGVAQGSSFYDEVSWADGDRMTCWLSPGYANAWTDYGGVWSGAMYRRRNGVVRLRGLIRSPGVNYVGAATIFVLPTSFKPGYGTDLLFVAGCGATGAIRLDVLNDGTVMTNGVSSGTTNTQDWVSLNGIQFEAGA